MAFESHTPLGCVCVVGVLRRLKVIWKTGDDKVGVGGDKENGEKWD